jgi:hypothetical protein
MLISTPLAAGLAFATAITVTLNCPADQPRASSAGSVVLQATATDAARQSGGSSSGYAFFPPNRPRKIAVTWDRDIPVTYLIAKRNARPHMFATIKEAFRRARVQTGIQFRYGGRAATSEPVGTADRPVVVVDFGTASSHPRLAKYHGGVVYAVGGPLLITNGATVVFTGGQITIDVKTTRRIGRGFRHCQLGDTLLHEVGHVLGLAHVHAPRQMMAPGWIRTNIKGWFQDGDLRGLRRLIHD